MELQVVLPDESPSMEVRTLVELAQAAEDLGFGTAWLPDHILPPGEYGSAFGGVYEPLVTIAHLSALTRRIRFGTSVVVVPLRNPFVLAKQVATVQELSAGRLSLGVGTGWSEPEFAAVGAEFSARGAVTDDALALLRHMWSGGAAPYTGRRFSYEQGTFAPVPTTPVPIVVGGNSTAALRRAARFGDVWQGLPSDVAAFRERRAMLIELMRRSDGGCRAADLLGRNLARAGGDRPGRRLPRGWRGRVGSALRRGGGNSGTHAEVHVCSDSRLIAEPGGPESQEGVRGDPRPERTGASSSNPRSSVAAPRARSARTPNASRSSAGRTLVSSVSRRAKVAARASQHHAPSWIRTRSPSRICVVPSSR